METMYEKIKSMSKEQMQEFIYWVYKNGVMDGRDWMCDDYNSGSYFGGAMLYMYADDVMPKVHELFAK